MKRSKKTAIGEIPVAPIVEAPTSTCKVETAKVEAPIAPPATVGCTCDTSAVGNLFTPERPKPKRKKKRPVKKEDNSMAVVAGLGAIALLGAALFNRA